ncbi:MAG: carboxymuconolactone decarboxylase family protein [Candidatus Omnitrophica bacterium]|nr:carboxymuconolactone decarboxylase family protein [Candidatus Omnitrophota bacterium]
MHIKPKKLREYPLYLRWIYRHLEKKSGQFLYPWYCWGRLPFLQVLFFLFWARLDRKKSLLDPALRALVQVRVAQLNGCAFCVDYNGLNLLKRTNSMDKFDHLQEWRTHSLFADPEKLVLEYTEEIARPESKVSTELMDRLKKHFSDDQIVELTALIAFQTMSAKFNAALDIPSQGMCKIP